MADEKCDKSRLLEEIMESVNLIVISQHGSTGSNLVHSILDNHDEMYIMPAHFQYPIWNEIIFEDGLNSWDGNNVITKLLIDFLGTYAMFGGRKSSCGSIIDVCGKVDSQLFCKKFWILFEYFYINSQAISIKRKDFVILTHVAFHWAVHGSLEKKKYICLHFHGYHYGPHDRAFVDFPKLKYLATIRDLREHCTSYKVKRIPKKGLPPFQEINDVYFVYYAFQWHFFIRNLTRIINIYGEKNILLLDLESMHASPLDTKNRLASFLDISPNTTLDDSTFLGKRWILPKANGNFSGLSKEKSRYTWNNSLDSYELNFIYSHMGSALSKLGYLKNNTSSQSFNDAEHNRFSWLNSMVTQPSDTSSRLIVDILLKCLGVQLNNDLYVKSIDFLSNQLESTLFGPSPLLLDTKNRSWSKSFNMNFSAYEVLLNLFKEPHFAYIFESKKIDMKKYARGFFAFPMTVSTIAMQASFANLWEEEYRIDY